MRYVPTCSSGFWGTLPSPEGGVSSYVSQFALHKAGQPGPAARRAIDVVFWLCSVSGNGPEEGSRWRGSTGRMGTRLDQKERTDAYKSVHDLPKNL